MKLDISKHGKFKGSRLCTTPSYSSFSSVYLGVKIKPKKPINYQYTFDNNLLWCIYKSKDAHSPFCSFNQLRHKSGMMYVIKSFY